MKKATLSVLFVLSLFFALYPATISPSIKAQGLGNCGSGFEFKDETDPYTYTSTNTITSVVVKAGSANQEDGACTTFTTDGTDGCYSVTGIGTNTATVTKVGSGRDCKDISHAEFFATVASTPSPTPTPTPDVTPTPTPSASPSATPSATPTPTPTPTPTATPSSTPSTDNGTGGGGSSSSSSSSSTGGQVLGATTLAKTGSADVTLALSGLVSGLAMTATSAVGFLKARRK